MTHANIENSLVEESNARARRKLRRRMMSFTLIELLIVIAIIGVLVAILLPALAHAKEQAKAVTCTCQLRQISAAVLAYAQDNSGLLPRSSHSAAVFGTLRWGQAVMPYLGYGTNTCGSGPIWDGIFYGLYRCPADPRRNLAWSYGKNIWFELTASEMAEVTGDAAGPTFWRLDQAASPAITIQFGEITEKNAADHIMAHFWLMGTTPEIDTTRHGEKSNYAFLDGHVRTLAFHETFDAAGNLDHWNPGR